MNVPALELEAVYKRFRKGELYSSLRDLVPALLTKKKREQLAQREFWALQDVSFSVGKGEAFGIIGSNGAGKSTILKLISGIMPPTRGSIRVEGRLSALIEVSAGFHPDLTGRENIYLNGAILGMTRAEIRQRFDEIVAFSELEEFIDTPVKRYSSGMFARLGFSVAAHVRPEILIVDEVLSVGDYLFQQKCLARMTEITKSDATIIFVSHNLRAVSALCSRSLLLDHGRVKMIGATNEVVTEYLTQSHNDRPYDSRLGIAIDNVRVGSLDAPRVLYDSEEYVDISVDVSAATPHSDLSVVIMIVDENQYPVFDTCTQRLGAGALSLGAGQRLMCTFRVRLSLAQGTYHVNAYLHRYVTNRPFDQWLSAATFFVAETVRVRGVANLAPVLVRCERLLKRGAQQGQESAGDMASR